MVELTKQLREHSASRWLHSNRVARYAVALGRQVGLDKQSIMALQCAALLQDVGMLSIPAHLHDKPSKLSRNERDILTKHSISSALMLRARTIPLAIVVIVQAHHEWYNGKGYPLGLVGEEIPIEARILTIADALVAMFNDRAYRPALSPAEICLEFEKGAGTQFDPSLVPSVKALLEAGLVPPSQGKLLRVISDDPTLCHQIEFASHPQGWETEVLPLEGSPPYLLGTGPTLDASATGAIRQPDLVIVDGTSAFAPEAGLIRQLGGGPTLWLDPPGSLEPALYRPLLLWKLLDHLDVCSSGYGTEGSECGGSFEPEDVVRVRVIIADPYVLFRQALKSWLDGKPDIEVVGEVKSPAEYRAAKANLDYDIAIVASDLLIGTHSTAPFRLTDRYLSEDEICTGSENEPPVIVLVADEDINGPAGRWGRADGLSSPSYIPRSTHSESLAGRLKSLYALRGVAAHSEGGVYMIEEARPEPGLSNSGHNAPVEMQA